ncbi:MAG: aryl-sulfate sulfohydrolase [Pirellulaceae bacterium]|nr:MAG: aryl-sulfate sulfohydrolase [Pirellulaceae bacterium]
MHPWYYITIRRRFVWCRPSKRPGQERAGGSRTPDQVEPGRYDAAGRIIGAVRQGWARWLLLWLFGSWVSAAAAEPSRPNILFVFIDDLGWRDTGFMGSDFYETPHLDHLAQQGMVFSNAYAAAANCAPSRASLLSGQYTPRHQIFNVGTGLRGNPKFSRLKHVPGTDTLSPTIRTWAHCLQDTGYVTAIMGKWHLSDDPRPYGFEVNVGGSHAGSPPEGYFPPHPGAPGLEEAPAGEYLTDRLHEEALQFIDANRHRPWMLFLSHFAVHTPLQAKKELVSKYERKPPGKMHDHAVMAAMIESIDEGVGRILSRLEELGLRENTIIIFTSDNGGYGPATDMAPLSGYKGTYFEGGIRVPLFIVWPGKVPPASRCDVPVINVDLYPTLCAMSGAKTPDNQPLDGVDLTPLLTGRDSLPDRAIYWHFPAYLQSYQRVDQQRDPLFRSRPCSIIRHGDWKLHQYFEDEALLLFNLRDDPGERHDLSAAYPQKTAELLKELHAWQRAVRAPIPREPNPKYDAQAEAAALARAAQRR